MTPISRVVTFSDNNYLWYVMIINYHKMAAVAVCMWRYVCEMMHRRKTDLSIRKRISLQGWDWPVEAGDVMNRSEPSKRMNKYIRTCINIHDRVACTAWAITINKIKVSDCVVGRVRVTAPPVNIRVSPRCPKGSSSRRLFSADRNWQRRSLTFRPLCPRLCAKTIVFF